MKKTARFERRILTYLFDYLISVIIAVLLYIYMGLSMLAVESYLLIYLMTMPVYFIIVSLSLFITNGFTFGSLVFQTRTVHKNNQRLKLGTSLLKGLVLSIFILTVINAAWMLSTHTQVTIFDKITDTTLV